MSEDEFGGMINAAAALPKKFGFDWWQVMLDSIFTFLTIFLTILIVVNVIIVIIVIIIVNNIREARRTSSRRSTRTATVPFLSTSGLALHTRTTRYPFNDDNTPMISDANNNNASNNGKDVIIMLLITNTTVIKSKNYMKS